MIAVIGDAVRLRLRVGIVLQQENVVVVKAAGVVKHRGDKAHIGDACPAGFAEFLHIKGDHAAEDVVVLRHLGHEIAERIDAERAPLALSDPLDRLNAVRMMPHNDIAAVFVDQCGNLALCVARLEGVLIPPVHRDNGEVGNLLRLPHLAGNRIVVDIGDIDGRALRG